MTESELDISADVDKISGSEQALVAPDGPYTNAFEEASMSDQFTTASSVQQPTAKAIILQNGMAVIVDEADYPEVSRLHWHAHKSHEGRYYARGTVGGTRVMMHVWLMGGSRPGYTVDHKNGNGLDNRRENLRWATGSEQQRNISHGRGRSTRKGVSWARRQRKWMATICISGKNKHLGYFNEEDEAALAYDRAALENYGEFACVNFPGGTNG